MNGKRKRWLIAAGVLVMIGLLLFVSVMTVYDWDFTKLNTVPFATRTYTVDQAFCKLSFETDTADIQLALSQDNKCRVICYEQENQFHSVAVANETLMIRAQDEREWYEHIGIIVGAPEITVYLPKTAYDTLTIEGSTGDIEIPLEFNFEKLDVTTDTGDVICRALVAESVKIGTSTGRIDVEGTSPVTLDLSVSTGNVTVADVICAGEIAVSVSTGKVHITDTECRNLISDGDTGDLILKNVIAEESFAIERTTGDVTFDGCDAGEISVTTDTGDVTGTLLSGKIFTVSTDTGDVEVPESVPGGKCRITTNTGDIRLSVQ